MAAEPSPAPAWGWSLPTISPGRATTSRLRPPEGQGAGRLACNQQAAGRQLAAERCTGLLGSAPAVPGAAQAEGLDATAGSPPGCQPPPGECFPPEQPTQPQPTSPTTSAVIPQPTPTAVDQGSESGTTATKSPSADAKQATESKQPPDQGSTRTQEPGGDLGPGEGGTSPTSAHRVPSATNRRAHLDAHLGDRPEPR
jgi:hypothetical protein